MRSPRLLLVLLAATLAVAPSAHAKRVIHLKVPKFVVPPRSDREVCTFVPLPMKKTFDLSGSTVANIGIKPTFTTHHFLMWVYQGTDLSAFPKEGTIVDSKACLDFGPTDTNQRALIVGSQAPVLRTKLPDGIAQQLKPTVSTDGKSVVGIILNSHWINSSDKPQKAAVKITLVAAKPHTVKQWLLPIFDVVANVFINVPPGKVKTESGSWGPGSLDLSAGLGGGDVPKGPACVVGVTSHMHKRGTHFTIDETEADGKTVIQRVLNTTTYTDPPQVSFTPPMLLDVGQRLVYTCTHDNGVTTPLKMGCEEKPGVVPGVSALIAYVVLHTSSGAARRCATDADCAGFGTGKCVPANLVFGFTSDDDMCIMPGGFYPANAQGSCDLTNLPTIN